MPINYEIQLTPLSQDEFHALDYEVMGLTFAIHREMGRFWHEKIYRRKLANRCLQAGFKKAVLEFPIQVSYQSFSKFYYIDLLIDDALIYELKAVQALSVAHRTQTLNYLFLTGRQHAKLVNMGPASVEHRFVSTRITSAKRYTFTINESAWRDLDEDSVWLKQLLTQLLREWGTFLDTHLFYDAIYHFRGGEENVVKTIEAVNGSQILGRQKVHLLNPAIAFKISSVTKAVSSYEQDLRRFIQYTPLRAIQWINFNHEQIMFKTVFK